MGESKEAFDDSRLPAVSLVIPCFNEEQVLPLLRDRINKIAHKLKNDNICSLDVLFVDDGSVDQS